MFKELVILISLLVVVKGNVIVEAEGVDENNETTTDKLNDESNETDSSTVASSETEGRGKGGGYLTESDGIDNNDVYESVRHGVKKPAAAVIKCSRRFTPGACMEPVYSVWTYVFNKQNCTERFGCRKSDYHNRFKSYNQCMHRCEPLREIYTDILSVEDGQSMLPRALRRWRDMVRRQEKNAPFPTTEQPDFENDNSMRPLAREEIDYGIERTVQSDGEWDGDSDEEAKVPYDIESYSVDSEILDHFYFDLD